MYITVQPLQFGDVIIEQLISTCLFYIHWTD